MPKNVLATKGVENSYGYIRSYWNNNKDDGKYLYCTVDLHYITSRTPPITLILLPSSLPSYLPLPTRSTEISRRLFDTCGLEPEHKKIPSCSEHYAVLNSEKLANFQLLSPADGHGPLHVQVLPVLTEHI